MFQFRLSEKWESQEDFKEMYEDLQNGDMDEEECQENLDELIAMFQEEDEE